MRVPLFISVLCCLLARQPAVAQGITQPEVFGLGVLSEGEVYRGSFAPDGRTFYYFKKVTPSQEDYRIFVARLTAGVWTKPEPVRLGGEYSDLYPALSKDGNRLVFSSYRPVPGDTSEKRNAHIWYVERAGQNWGEPVFLSGVNKLGHYHSWVELSADGALYFRRTTPDWGQSETLVARRQGKGYAAPIRYEDAERWKTWRTDMRIAGGSPGPDGKVVFLDVATRNPQTGRGAADIWVSLKQGQTWSEPKPLGVGINSDGFDVFPFFSPDGRDLYFVRDFKTFYRIPWQAALKSIGRTGAK